MFTNEPRKGKVEYLLLDGTLEEREQHLILNLTGVKTSPELAAQGVVNPILHNYAFYSGVLQSIKRSVKRLEGQIETLYSRVREIAFLAQQEIDYLGIDQNNTILYCLIDCPPYASSSLEAALWNQNFHPLYTVDGVLIDNTESKAA